jgi:hypothetical protein
MFNAPPAIPSRGLAHVPDRYRVTDHRSAWIDVPVTGIPMLSHS